MKRHWKKFAILGLVIAVAVMFCLPGTISADEKATFTKTVSPNIVAIGEEIMLTYTFTVSVPEGDYALKDVKITDSNSDIAIEKDGVIDGIKPGQTTSVTGTVTVTPNTLGALENTATANGVWYEWAANIWTPIDADWKWFERSDTATVKVVDPDAPGKEGKEGKEGVAGVGGSRGSTGRAGEDVVRMFSTDGGNEDPWSLVSDKSDKYMLESTTYAGKTTHIIVGVDFVVEQADGSLVFMAE